MSKNRLKTKIKIVQLEDAHAVAAMVAKRVSQSARKAIKQRREFHCVLAGGSTPKLAYEILSKSDNHWSHWHLYLGDERVLAANDPQRNSLMIEQSWLNKLSAPLPHWYPIPAELECEQVLQSYQKTLLGIKSFDMVLLGIGEDGHTASLFPGHEHPCGVAIHAVEDAPKPPPKRFSLSLERLTQSREIIVIVTGQAKQSAMLQWLDGLNIPIAKLTNKAEQAKVELLIDHAACPDPLH